MYNNVDRQRFMGNSWHHIPCDQLPWNHVECMQTLQPLVAVTYQWCVSRSSHLYPVEAGNARGVREVLRGCTAAVIFLRISLSESKFPEVAAACCSFHRSSWRWYIYFRLRLIAYLPRYDSSYIPRSFAHSLIPSVERSSPSYSWHTWRATVCCRQASNLNLICALRLVGSCCGRGILTPDYKHRL